MNLKVVCQKNEANEKNAPGSFIHCRGKTPGTNRLIFLSYYIMIMYYFHLCSRTLSVFHEIKYVFLVKTKTYKKLALVLYSFLVNESIGIVCDESSRHHEASMIRELKDVLQHIYIQ